MAEPGAVALVVAALVLAATQAHAEEPAAVATRVLAAREEALGRQHDAARAVARKQAWMTYRLARRRALGFFGAPERRRADATSVDLAAVALRRSLEEATLLGNELAVVREERTALELRSPAEDAAAPALAWPVRPNVVGVPGRKREPVTGVELDGGALEILARLDEPVGAPAPGEVRRVERLAEGGWAIALAHEGGLVAVLGGLRTPTVAIGERVEQGATVGLVGRTLDGAPVLTLAAFRRGQALDPRALLPAAGPGRVVERRPSNKAPH